MWSASRTVNRVAIIFILAGCASQTRNPQSLNDIYQQSIASAALKEPDYARLLEPIGISKGEVTVAHIQPYPTIDTNRFIWVTAPGTLRKMCRDKPDPLLAIQQALGLPPEKREDMRVFTFEVRTADIFRPCASSPDITTTQCSMELPQSVPLASTQTAAEHFVLKQIMDSYRNGFKDLGYPFTAMGWSYDWNPDSPSHQGVSEYVVKPGAVISNVSSVDPAVFCQAESRTVSNRS